jgi:transposase-like protein
MVGFGRPSGRQAQREWWRCQIERHEQSSLSVTKFCARIGVRPKTFYAWRQRLRATSLTRSQAPGKRQPRPSSTGNAAPIAPFLPVAVRDDATAGQLEITLSNSCVLRLTGAVDPDLLRVAIDGAGRLTAKRRGVY